MNATSDALSLIGRIFLAVIFLVSGFGKVGGFQDLIGAIASKGFPMSQVFAVATIAIELGAGLMLVFGWKARWAAFLLAVFTAIVTYFFHNFWAALEAEKMMQQIQFMKNLALIGGLLLVTAFGPGRLSVDKR
jgi:putative oxidoreductase